MIYFTQNIKKTHRERERTSEEEETVIAAIEI